MSKKWVYQYGEDTIEVENTALSGERLFVNGELQDESNGLKLSAALRGRLKTGEEIKASLGGTLAVKCSLFVDNKLQLPIA